MTLIDAALCCLETADPAAKVALTHTSVARWGRDELAFADLSPPLAIGLPGRPARPNLVSPRDTPPRGLGSIQGRAAFLHAIAHIEFNAINLAWDAVYRFRGMPAGFYADWASVADDEARHFSLLSTRLVDLGFAYGDFDAHDGLWDMAMKTADTCVARMALVPRVLEARGLDVTPGMIHRLRSLGDTRSAEILEVILREEIRHVAIGSYWFNWCCEREGLVPESTFIALVRDLAKGAIRGPFNLPARAAAGFADSEMVWLSALSSRS